MRAVLALVSLLISLGIAEFTARIFWTPPELRTMRSFDFRACLQPDTELGWIPQPNVLVEYPPFGASFRTNEHGLRGPLVSRERRPGVRRVLVLGDSFAWGHGVSEGEAFCEVLARRMPGVEFINLGVPGFNLRSERAWFERVGAAFAPDVVIVALCQNDLHDFEGPGETWSIGDAPPPGAPNPERSSTADGGGLLKRVKSTLASTSLAYSMLQQAVNSNKPLARLAVACRLKEPLGGFELLDDNLHAALRRYPPSVERAMEQARRDLALLAGAIRAAGARPMLALIPARQAIDAAALTLTLAYTSYEPADFDLDKPYRLLAAAAEEIDLFTINPLDAFRQAHAAGSALYLPGDLHFSPAGHGLFAAAIEQPLRELLYMP